MFLFCSLKVNIKFSITDPVVLSGEGQYNLNILKEIDGTSSYNALSQGITGCQNKESVGECTTRSYKEKLRKNCGCLPLAIRILEQVKSVLSIADNDNSKI